MFTQDVFLLLSLSALGLGFSDPARTEPHLLSKLAFSSVSFKELPLFILTLLATFHCGSFVFRCMHQDPTSLSLDHLYNHGLGRLIWPPQRQQMVQVVA